jgi:hypothetical protein
LERSRRDQPGHCMVRHDRRALAQNGQHPIVEFS